MFNLRRGEGLPALIAGLFFFCILSGYMLVRPVREALGVERGMGELYSLFIATMVASLALNPVFGWLVGKYDRRVFLPISYGAIVLMLLSFAWFRAAAPDELIGVWSGRVFFVWLSVVNLFMTGLFWSLMSDCFAPGEAKRVFPCVAVGGTLGAAVGSAAAWALSTGGVFSPFDIELFDLGDVKLTAPQFMLVSAALITVAGMLSVLVSLMRPQHQGGPARVAGGVSFKDALDGLRLTLRSPYLLAISGYIGLLAVTATFLYFTEKRLALAVSDEPEDLIQAFARIDFLSQMATLVLQLMLTARLVRLIGVGWTLVILPAVVAAGFGVLLIGEVSAWSPEAMLLAITIVQAVFRASKYAITRPARETLFTVLGRDEKYKAKSLIDTFVYRAGDTAGAGVDAGLAALAIASLTALAATVAPIAIIMAGLGLWLGTQQSKLASLKQGDRDEQPDESVQA